MGWLLVAAAALMLVAGWCTSAEAALLRVSRAGAKELGRSAGESAAACAHPTPARLNTHPVSTDFLMDHPARYGSKEVANASYNSQEVQTARS